MNCSRIGIIRQSIYPQLQSVTNTLSDGQVRTAELKRILRTARRSVAAAENADSSEAATELLITAINQLMFLMDRLIEASQDPTGSAGRPRLLPPQRAEAICNPR